MRHMVIAKQDPLRVDLEAIANQRLDPELVGDPATHRLAKDTVGAGEGRERRKQQALELHKGLLVEDDVVDILDTNAGSPETELDGEVRETAVMLHAGKTLFSGGCHHDTIMNQRRRAVVVIEG